jgi:hypothetical protein
MVGCAVESGVSECFTNPLFERLESLLPAVKDVIWSLPVADRVKLGRLLDDINTLGEESTATDPALLQAESALLAHRSAGASADRHLLVANSTDKAFSGKSSKKCGAIYIAESWTCCLDKHGNGLGAAPGSTCCLSPKTGGVLVCGAGSVCNENSGLCYAPGSAVCGDLGCAPGSECWEPTKTCYVPLPGSSPCGEKTMIQCADSGICCGNGTAPLCGGKGSTCCYKNNIASICASGMSCDSDGICVAR